MTREHFSTHEDKTAPNRVLQAIKKGVAAAALMPAAVIGVAGCSNGENPVPAATATTEDNKWTEITNKGLEADGDTDSPVSKICDGKNLVYRGRGRDGNIAVSPNDPQCTGKTPENIVGTPNPEATATDLATAIPTPLPTHE